MIRLSRNFIGAFAMMQLAACSGDSELAKVAPGLKLTGAVSVTDTVGAIRTELLQVVVGDESGRPTSHATVVFTSVTLTEPGRVGPVLVTRSTDSTFRTFYYDSTDANGRVSVRVRLGDAAGRGALIVHIPSLQLTDTAEYTILPGNAKFATLQPDDTAMVVGRPLTLRPRVIDRLSNVRTEHPLYRVIGSGATVSASGVVTATALSRFAVIASVPGNSPFEDTTYVSVVPDLPMAVRSGNKIVTLQLDGSEYREIPTTFLVVEPGPVWSADGQRMLVSVKTLVNGVVYTGILGVDGSFQYLLPSPFFIDGAGGANAYDYSRNGQGVYFTAGSALYRSAGVGSSPEPLCVLLPPPQSGCAGTPINSVSLSPDGLQLTFQSGQDISSNQSIRILDISSRAERLNIPGGRSPKWSPTDDQIAYWSNNRIWLVNSNGTNTRAITPVNHAYIPGVAWTRDGKWIVAQYQGNIGFSGLTTTLVNVASGLELPLPYFHFPTSNSLPDFKPIP